MQETTENIYEEAIRAIVEAPRGNVVRIAFGAPKAGAPKAVLRPILLKKNEAWQCEKVIGGAAFHENIPDSGLRDYATRLLEEGLYGQISIVCADSVISCRVTKKRKLQITRTANKSGGQPAAKPSLSHDSAKKYLLPEGMPAPPFVDLGVFTQDFRVVKAKYWKFKQINAFLANVDSGLIAEPEGDLRIVEFGCG